MEGFINDERYFKKFKQHLEIQENCRILFSGQYGIGKSTFLRQFFHKNNDAYKVIHLYPVNYSISSNADILDLLKYDIIYEILDKYNLKEHSTLSSLSLFDFLCFKAPEIIVPFIESVSKIGKPLVKISKALAKIEIEYEKFENNNEEIKKLQSLINKVEKNSSTAYQQDFYNRYIESKLLELKKGSETEKTVLIIDDLDRVDPEHIFRLFNIFSAHFELTNDEGTNKFGFDKVIFVCDLENIKKIYEHRYGKDVDFSGYIDKFYSIDVFQFSNISVLSNWLIHQIGKDEVHNDGIDLTFISGVLGELLKTGVINFRNIKNFNRELYLKKRYTFNNTKNSDEFSFCQLPIHIEILSMICGNIENLIIKMQKCQSIIKERGEPLYPWSHEMTLEYFENFLIPVLDFRAHHFRVANHTINTVLLTGNANASGPEFGYSLQKSGNLFKAKLVVNKIPNSNKMAYYFWSSLTKSTKILKEQLIIV